MSPAIARGWNVTYGSSCWSGGTAVGVEGRGATGAGPGVADDIADGAAGALLSPLQAVEPRAAAANAKTASLNQDATEIKRPEPGKGSAECLPLRITISPW